MKLTTALLLTITLLPALEGCHVPLRAYRLDNPAIIVPPEFTTPQPTKAADIAKQEKPCLNPENPICLAFIEVDDMGELFAKGEVDTALDVIRKANDQAETDPTQAAPVVITFVHGWKNNAAEDNDNVAGFKLALQAVYQRLQETAPNQKHHIIGIFIGWRGNLIKQSWPVAQQLSYYNREAAATRVPGAALSSALTQIATRTHENKDALAIYIGHSFGGLLLERSLSEATASQIAQATIFDQEAKEAQSAAKKQTDPEVANRKLNEAQEKAVAARLATDSRADLVIFINPAGAASEAKPMLDFLTYKGYVYRPGAQSDLTTETETTSSAGNDADRPLFVSLTSTADLATKVAMPIGHSLPDLEFKAEGSFRTLDQQDPAKKYSLECFDPHKTPPFSWRTKQQGAVDQSSYYMSTAPHMPILQSHVMLKQIGADEMQVSSTGQKIPITVKNAVAGCNRDLFNQQGLNIVSTFRLYDTQTCFAVQERPGRCNGTPYWLMEIDPDVVPDHSTIFTKRFIWFLIDTYFAPKGHPLQRLSPRLVQTQSGSH
jgi:hypothetical protein